MNSNSEDNKDIEFYNGFSEDPFSDQEHKKTPEDIIIKHEGVPCKECNEKNRCKEFRSNKKKCSVRIYSPNTLHNKLWDILSDYHPLTAGIILEKLQEDFNNHLKKYYPAILRIINNLKLFANEEERNKVLLDIHKNKKEILGCACTSSDLREFCRAYPILTSPDGKGKMGPQRIAKAIVKLGGIFDLEKKTLTFKPTGIKQNDNRTINQLKAKIERMLDADEKEQIKTAMQERLAKLRARKTP